MKKLHYEEPVEIEKELQEDCESVDVDDLFGEKDHAFEALGLALAIIAAFLTAVILYSALKLISIVLAG